MPAPTTSAFWNSAVPAAPSGEQNIVFASDGAVPEQDISASDPVMVGDTGSGGLAGNVPAPPSGSAAAGKYLKADGTFAVPPGTGVTVTQVQQEALIASADTGTANAYAVTLSPAPTIVEFSAVVFKAANANTGTSTLAVNGGSATPIYKEVSTPLASGDILAGQIVTVIYDGTNWQIAATGALPAGVLVPALRGTADGNGTTGSTFTVTWPSGTVTGDLVIICCNHDYNLTNPSGWTQNNLSNGFTWNLLITSKVMTSGDISTGSVTISAAGSQDWAYIVTAFIGGTAGIRETDVSVDSGLTVTPITTSSAVVATDSALYYASQRGSGVPTISRGTLQTTNTGANSHSLENTEAITASGAYTVNFSTGVAGTAFAVIIVKGVPLAAVVTSLNGLTGALSLAAGSNVTLTPSGNTITIAAAGGGGSVTSVAMTVPTGLAVSGTPITSMGTLGLTWSGTIPDTSLPLATSSTPGAVQPDNSTITISAGVISASGGLSNPMTTEGDIIYGGASGTPTRLAAGTSGDVLQTNGTGSAPTWVPAGGGGGSYPTPTTITPSGVSSATITSCITSSYRDYEIRISNVLFGTAGANLTMQFSVDNGSTWDTASSYQDNAFYTELNGAASGNLGTSLSAGFRVLVLGSVSTTAESNSARYTLFNPLSSTQYKYMFGQSQQRQNSDSNAYMMSNGFRYVNTNAVNAVKFICSSGNFSGTITMQPLPM